MLASVVTANNDRMPITTMTITVCTRATACEPTTLRTVIARTTTTAKTFSHVSLPSATAELA